MRISIYKTILFNYMYLGIKGLVHPVFLIGKNLIFYSRLKGRIELVGKFDLFSIHIGIDENELSNYKLNRSLWKNSGKIIFRGNANLGCGIKINTLREGTVDFGENCSINGSTEIIAAKEIKFGNNVNISWGCLFIDTDFHSIYNFDGECINKNQVIKVGNSVWIGAQSVILKGSRICDNTIIGANSTITKGNFQSNQIIVGNNQIINNNVTWRLGMPK